MDDDFQHLAISNVSQHESNPTPLSCSHTDANTDVTFQQTDSGKANADETAESSRGDGV